MKNQKIFISGIDTDCGKTYITGLLAYHFRKAGINCVTTKFVQTGCLGISDDILEHRRIMEVDVLPEDKSGLTCPFVYSFPASPHLSAKIDKRNFSFDKLSESIGNLLEKFELVLIEGAGGLTVPITDEVLTSDYLIENQQPIVLVSSSKLGSINHTLLSIDFCIKNWINLIAVIYNQFPDDDVEIAISTYKFLEKRLKCNYPGIKLIHGDDLQKNSSKNVADLIL